MPSSTPPDRPAALQNHLIGKYNYAAPTFHKKYAIPSIYAARCGDNQNVSLKIQTEKQVFLSKHWVYQG